MAEQSFELRSLIQPYFLATDPNEKKEVPGFSGVFSWGLEPLLKRIEADRECGVRSFLFFAKAESKDATGTGAYQDNGLLPTVVSEIKKRFGKDIVLFSDVCLCPFTDHGHCGLLSQTGEVQNDKSLSPLAKMALAHARAGVDFVAPSDMMDGRVGFIRRALDAAGFENTGILAYTAKYASNYYGPFREALDSSPKQGDRATYQMDFRNRREALRELELDVSEGADLVMVKPALAYLDVIAEFKRTSPVPVVAYSVSGEYELVKQLARVGMADESRLAMENLTAIFRAGADIVISYFTSQIAEKRWG